MGRRIDQMKKKGPESGAMKGTYLSLEASSHPERSRRTKIEPSEFCSVSKKLMKQPFLLLSLGKESKQRILGRRNAVRLSAPLERTAASKDLFITASPRFEQRFPLFNSILNVSLNRTKSQEPRTKKRTYLTLGASSHPERSRRTKIEPSEFCSVSKKLMKQPFLLLSLGKESKQRILGRRNAVRLSAPLERTAASKDLFITASPRSEQRFPLLNSILNVFLNRTKNQEPRTRKRTYFTLEASGHHGRSRMTKIEPSEFCSVSKKLMKQPFLLLSLGKESKQRILGRRNAVRLSAPLERTAASKDLFITASPRFEQRFPLFNSILNVSLNRTKSQEPRTKKRTYLTLGASSHPERSRRTKIEPRGKNQEPRRIHLRQVSSIKYQVSRRIHQKMVLSTIFKFILRLTTYDLRLALLTFYFILFTLPSRAQQLTPLSQEMNRRVEYKVSLSDINYFTLLKPFIQSDSVYPVYNTYSTGNNSQSWLTRKLFHESLVEVDSSDYYLYFNPAFDFSLGRDNTGRHTFTNTRGFNAGGRLGKTFAFGTSFYENQAIFPGWVHNGISNKVITGQGLGRLSNQTWDYAHSTGYISFSPVKKLNIQAGQGKNFIGDGYRSLLLSDVAYNYPYGRISFLSDKFMYSWMLGIIQDINSKRDNIHTYFKRLISSHILSTNIAPGLQFSIIKNTVYNDPDTTGKFSPDLEEFNPVMLPINSNKSNSIWGINVKVILKRNLWLYGQTVLDNLFDEGAFTKGFQAGSKYFRAFGVRGLYLQVEYNTIDPETYTSQNKTLHWLHYGEPLAHPLGNNLREGLFNMVYTWKRWQVEAFLRASRQFPYEISVAPAVNSGFPANGMQKDILHSYTQLNWFLNPKTTAHFSVGFILHRENITGLNTNQNMVYFSFRTSLFNNYLFY